MPQNLRTDHVWLGLHGLHKVGSNLKGIISGFSEAKLVWLCTTHFSLVLELRTWLFIQALSRVLSNGNSDSPFKFYKDVMQKLYIRKFAISKLIIQHLVLTWINRIIMSENFYYSYWIECPKNLLFKLALRTNVISHNFIYSCISFNKCECEKQIDCCILKDCLFFLNLFQCVIYIDIFYFFTTVLFINYYETKVS